MFIHWSMVSCFGHTKPLHIFLEETFLMEIFKHIQNRENSVGTVYIHDPPSKVINKWPSLFHLYPQSLFPQSQLFSIKS